MPTEISNTLVLELLHLIIPLLSKKKRDKIRKSNFTRNKGHERKLEKDLEIKLKCEKDNRIPRLIIQIRGQQ